MTTAQINELETDEAAEVLRWRLTRLVSAGYRLEDAIVVASNVEIDLHCAAYSSSVAARLRRRFGSCFDRSENVQTADVRRRRD